MSPRKEMESLSHHRKILILFFGGSLLFNIGYFSAPLFQYASHQSLASFIYQIFSPLCHQMESRSFLLFELPLAVCARCTGIYIGFLAALLYLLFTLNKPLKTIPKKRYLFLLLSPALLDFILNVFGIFSFPIFWRAFTGFLLGVILTFYIMPGICEIGSQRIFKSQFFRKDELLP